MSVEQSRTISHMYPEDKGLTIGQQEILAMIPTREEIRKSIEEVNRTPTVNVIDPNTKEIITLTYSEFVGKLFKKLGSKEVDLNHAVIGLMGENAELLEGVLKNFDAIAAINGLIVAGGKLADAIKNNSIYGKELNVKNVIEELGDARFYMQAVMNICGLTDNNILQGNANKLGERYKKLEYSDSAAIARADKNLGE